MHDGIQLAARGLPAVSIITEGFDPTARETAALYGLPDYEFALIEHPICRVGEDDLRAKARIATDQIEKLLLTGS